MGMAYANIRNKHHRRNLQLSAIKATLAGTGASTRGSHRRLLVANAKHVTAHIAALLLLMLHVSAVLTCCLSSDHLLQLLSGSPHWPPLIPHKHNRLRASLSAEVTSNRCVVHKQTAAASSPALCLQDRPCRGPLQDKGRERQGARRRRGGNMGGCQACVQWLLLCVSRLGATSYSSLMNVASS